MMRPWDRETLRVGLKLAGDAQGWWLYRLEHAGQRGEVAVPSGPDERARETMTAAEFAALRRECGLSQQEAREFLDVSQKTASFWENKLGVPVENDGRARDLVALRAAMDRAVWTVVETAVAQRDRSGVVDIDLFAYRAADYPASTPAAEGLPHGAHWRLLSLTADALARDGFNVSILYA